MEGEGKFENHQRCLEDPDRGKPELKTLFDLQGKLPELKVAKIFG